MIGKKDGEINGLNQAVSELKANLEAEKQKCSGLQAELASNQSALSDAFDKLKTQHQLIGELKSQLEASRSELDDERTQTDEARLKHSEEVSRLKAQINMERKNGVLNATDLERQIELLKAKLKRESEGLNMSLFGSYPLMIAGLGASDDAVRKLRDENTQLSALLMAAKDERDNAARRYATAQQSLEDVERDNNKLKRQLNTLTDDLSRSKNMCKQLDERLTTERAQTLADVQKQLAQSQTSMRLSPTRPNTSFTASPTRSFAASAPLTRFDLP